jgi:radical SAM superfamily enzyme YgiQ (UPF0313 family)
MRQGYDLPKDPAILFVNPDRGMSNERIVHQGISAVAARLREHGLASHAVLTSQCDDESIVRAIEEYGYRHVGFFVTSDESATQYAKGLISRIKARRADIVFMAGGPHATLGTEELLAEIPDLDICVHGEGEESCVEILSGAPWPGIAGITFRQGAAIVKNPSRKLLSASDLPIPLRDIYIDAKWNAHSLSTSRGCPNNCHFCIGHEIFGRTIRFKPLEKIDQELRWIYEHEDRSLIVSINDDMFNMRRDRTLALMKIFKSYPFRYFPRGMRADRLDAETAKAMRDAGVVGTSIGIESADNESLRLMCKGETIEDIERGIRHLRDNGIGIVGQFIIGNIGDTLETVKKTIDFALRHRFEDVNMSCAIPFPGTALREYVLRNNLMLDQPHHFDRRIDGGNTVIYFETPAFPLADRIMAVELAVAAGLLKDSRSLAEVPG